MSHQHRRVAAALITAAALCLTACNGSSTPSAAAPSTSQATTTTAAATSTAAAVVPAPSTPATDPAPATSAAAPAAAGGGRCTDLSNAQASAALGKATTVKADPGPVTLPGLSICNVTIAGEVYPVQLVVDTANGAQLFATNRTATGIKDVSGVGDKAFVSQISVEALAKGVDIKVTGPAGPVLSGNFAVPTALAKAMVAALR